MRTIKNREVEMILMRDAKLYAQWHCEQPKGQKSEASYYYGCYVCICDILDVPPFKMDPNDFATGAYNTGYIDYALFIIEQLLGYATEIDAPHAPYIKTANDEAPSKRVNVHQWLRDETRKDKKKMKEQDQKEKKKKKNEKLGIA